MTLSYMKQNLNLAENASFEMCLDAEALQQPDQQGGGGQHQRGVVERSHAVDDRGVGEGAARDAARPSEAGT